VISLRKWSGLEGNLKKVWSNLNVLKLRQHSSLDSVLTSKWYILQNGLPMRVVYLRELYISEGGLAYRLVKLGNKPSFESSITQWVVYLRYVLESVLAYLAWYLMEVV